MARRPKTTTMAQVAEHAGVSQATVSLVLNNVAGSRVAEATKERVLEAVRDLDYRTNAFAKTLRSGESEMIGFISDEVASSPFAGGLLKGAQLLAWENGNVILTVDTYNDAGLEQAAVEMMQSYRVRGVVYASMYHRVIDVPEALSGVPTVVVNAQDRAGLVPSVFPDEEMGGYAATRQLVEAGHTKIAMINIQPEVSDLPAGIGRLAGFRRALTEAGLSAYPDWILSGTGIVEDGLRLTAQLMEGEDRPTAIFCGNDRTAWGAYRALEARGLTVPDDCSIIGFDNHEMLAPHLDPGLSTVALPYEQMARTAIDLLLNPTPSPSLHIPLECTVVTRGSVAKAKA
ncbi:MULTISPECIES: LacI family DNA-binding transcriptional regulator [unclassified Pseudoclavibacter]|jgi:LacI family transcriptional regulator|uniref:LacI family DNA-binding transcriptional regulator n=1 Tax=unclassified Pseudoclavibacter TaxID=2615177 RepID=UPI000CE819A1|nr:MULTISPECIES: LacI family DNA-binding transcriptional regulator [unclassified Pseudoclavibacter]PPG29819.1 LacI family transcriptional regulator [Pseudoclavibacter sp. RFBB5]PPG39625.1 LacI family transcriptional regulator [Pseudoclavibacter sp. RFBA6]